MEAKQFLENMVYITDDGEPKSVHDSVESIESAMIAYAEAKVKEAVQAIKTNLKLTSYFYEQAEAHGILEGDTIDWNTIDAAVETVKFK